MPPYPQDEEIFRIGRKAIPIFVVFFIAMIFLFSGGMPFVVIGAGERGVVFNRIGGVSDRIMGEGLNFKTPFVDVAIPMEVRVQKQQIKAEGSSKDLQTVTIEVALNYHIDPLKVNKLYQEVGKYYDQRVIEPAVQESVKAAAARYPLEQIVTQRSEVREMISADLAARLGKYYLSLDALSITEIDFSAEFDRIIEDKQIAEQKIKKAEYEKIMAEQEKQKVILEAQAKAESQRLMRQTVDSNVIALRFIEKWDGKLPQIMSGKDGNIMSMIDLKSLTK